MGRCDGHGGDVMRFLGGETVVRKFDSHQEGVKGIRKVCQLMRRCDGNVGGVKGRGEF